MEKIAGYLLWVREEEPTGLLVEYLTPYKRIRRVRLKCDFPKAEADRAKAELQSALNELPGAQGDQLLELQGWIESLRVQVLTSEIHAAFHHEGRLDLFFEMPLPSREEIVTVAEAKKQARNEQRKIEILVGALRAKNKQTDSLHTLSHEVKDILVLTIPLLRREVWRSIQDVAKQLSEDPKEVYYSLVNDVEPFFTLDKLIKCLENEENFIKMFVEKLNPKRCETFMAARLKQLRLTWRRGLSEETKYVMNRLLGEFGAKFELPNDEQVQAAKLSREDFQKRENEVWLPTLRGLLKQKQAVADTRPLTAVESQHPDVGRGRASASDRERTRDAVGWVYKQKKKDNPQEKLQSIAGQAVLKFFPEITQFSGEKTKYRTPTLNPEWKRKRDSLRCNAGQKLRDKKKQKRPGITR